MIVYAVEAGGYDDFGVRALFSTREAAEQYVEAWPEREHAGVSPWDIDTAHPQVEQGYKQYSINMANDGTVIEIFHRSPDHEGPELAAHDKCLGYRLTHTPPGWKKVTSQSKYVMNIVTGPGLLGCVWARDEEEAKVMAEAKRREIYDV